MQPTCLAAQQADALPQRLQHVVKRLNAVGGCSRGAESEREGGAGEQQGGVLGSGNSRPVHHTDAGLTQSRVNATVRFATFSLPRAPEASARAEMVRAVMVFTFWFSSCRPAEWSIESRVDNQCRGR